MRWFCQRAPEFVISMFAVAKLGATIVPLNPRLTTPELQYRLRHSEAACAITIEEYHGIQYLELFEDLLVQLPDLRYLVTVGDEELWYDDRIFQFEDLLSAGGGRDYPSPQLDPKEDLFTILYTSGTTGKPKGVALTHENVVSTTLATVQAIGLGPEDRVIGVTALFHAFGIGPGCSGQYWLAQPWCCRTNSMLRTRSISSTSMASRSNTGFQRCS